MFAHAHFKKKYVQDLFKCFSQKESLGVWYLYKSTYVFFSIKNIYI